MFVRAFIFGLMILGFGCARDALPADDEIQHIVSLDFCADQYLLALADPGAIAGLSPDAKKSFSYYRKRAEAFPVVRPRAEDILTVKPDAVIRTYGGGPNIAPFLERAGVEVIQINYASSLADIRANAISVADALGAPDKGKALVEEMARRLAALPQNNGGEILYLTSKGAVAGRGTMIDELMIRAGRENFEEEPGWGFLSLEKLAYERPAMIAAGFFDGPDARSDQWSPAQHPVAKRALASAEVVDIPGAQTACGAWFIVDAVEAMARP